MFGGINLFAFMKQKLTALFTLVFGSIAVYGQFIDVPTTMRTPYGNVKTTNRIYVGTPNYRWWGNRKVKSTDTYNIKVVYKNDSTAKVDGVILLTDSASVILYDSTFTILPRDTREITCSAPGMKKVKGLPTDSTWRFQLSSGSVKAYANLPFTEEAIIALQKDEGELVPFSKELLLEWIGVSTKIVEMVEKGKYLEAIRYYNGQL